MTTRTMPFETTLLFPIPPVPTLSPQWQKITGIAVDVIECTESVYFAVHHAAAETPALVPLARNALSYLGWALNSSKLDDVLKKCESGMGAMRPRSSQELYDRGNVAGRIYAFPNIDGAFGKLEEVVWSLEGRLGFGKG